MTRYIYLLFFSIVISCSPKISGDQKKSTDFDNNKDDYTATAYEALGVTPITFEKNASAKYVLATYVNEAAVPGAASVKIAVINMENNEVVLKQVLNNGTARWIGDFTIEIVAPPGIPNGNQSTLKDYTTFYDVKTGKKVKKLDVKITD
ncbi:MAG: hypothetical protein ACI9XJ_001638 [Marivirga sp.]|jgi:hypothetical protein